MNYLAGPWTWEPETREDRPSWVRRNPRNPNAYHPLISVYQRKEKWAWSIPGDFNRGYLAIGMAPIYTSKGEAMSLADKELSRRHYKLTPGDVWVSAWQSALGNQ